MLYYVAPSIPFIFYAFIRGWPRLTDWLARLTPAFVERSSIDTKSVGTAATMAAVLSGLLVVNVFFSPSPLSLQFWTNSLRPAPFKTQSFHHSVYRVTEHHRRAREFSELIPESAIVSAPQFLHPLLASKRGTMVFPKLEALDGRARTEFVLFDKTNNGLNPVSPAFVTQQEFDIIEKDTNSWKLLKAEDDYYLYKRRSASIGFR